MQQFPDGGDARTGERGNAALLLAALLAVLAVVLWWSWSFADQPEIAPTAVETSGDAEAADANLARDVEQERAQRAEDASFAKDANAAADEKPFVRTRHHVLVRVIDARTKEPVEGAEVVAAPFDETPTQEAEREAALQFASAFSVHLKVGQKEKTDSAGRAWIRVRNRGMVFAHKEQRFGRADGKEFGEQGIEIRLASAREVSVRVVGFDGAPLVRVPLGLFARYARGEMSDEFDDWSVGSTDDQGVLLLRPEEHLGAGAPPSAFEVYVRAPGLVSTRASIANGETEIVLRMPAHGSLRVRATGVDKQPLADAPLWSCWLSGDENSQNDGGVTHSTAEGRGGVAWFRYVGLGKNLTLSIQCSLFYFWLQVQGPTAAGQEVVHELSLAKPSTFVVRARLLDADGSPLADRRVTLHSDSYQASASTDADGRMSLCLRGDDDNPKPLTFRILAVQRGKSPHAFAPVTLLPGRDNDLGELRAIEVEIVATGKFEADAPLLPGLHCWVESDQRGRSRYDQGLFVSVIDDDDTFLVCRTVERRSTGMKLGVRAQGFLSVDPIPFSQGDSIVVKLRRCAAFSARLLLDPAVSWLVERSRIDVVARSADGETQLINTQLVDGEWVCDSASLAPGVYSISVEPGDASGDLAQIDGVRIGVDEPKDPRLHPWDLRSVIQLLTVRLKRPDGSRMQTSGSVFRRRDADGEWESAASLENGVAQFLGNSSPADLYVWIDGHPPIRRTGVIGTLDLVLPEPIETRIVLDGVAPIATAARIVAVIDAGAWAKAQGLPDWVSPAVAFDWLCEEATAKAKLTPPVDFSLRIYRVLGEDRSEELGVVPVSVREGQKEVRVAVPPALRAALAQFAKPGAVPTPSPAAPTNGGR